MIFNTLDMNLTRLLLWLLFKRIFAKKKICLKKICIFLYGYEPQRNLFFLAFFYFVLFFFTRTKRCCGFCNFIIFVFLDTANSAASLSVQGLLSTYVNGGFCCCFFKKTNCMSDIPGGETICILKGVFECNLMEWKPQYLFQYTNSTVRLISDDCFFIFICTFFFVYCFAFPFAQSGLKDFTFTCCFIFGSETQAGCSSVVGLFCYFILF